MISVALGSQYAAAPVVGQSIFPTGSSVVVLVVPRESSQQEAEEGP